MGYYRAGFDVVGVDNVGKLARHYPFTFYEGDAIAYVKRYGDLFAAIHASPPCKDFTVQRTGLGKGYEHGSAHLLPDTREALIATGRPWVIENVPGAPMRADFTLCGCNFDLPGLRRKRLFETSWSEVVPPLQCRHSGRAITVAGRGTPGRDYRAGLPPIPQSARREAMGIGWMNRDELNQAVPPAYTEWIGARLMDQVLRRAA